MTSYRVHSRAPGARVATLDGPWGRHVWTRGEIRRSAGLRACTVCGTALFVGAEAWRALKTNDPVARRARICAPCLDCLAAA